MRPNDPQSSPWQVFMLQMFAMPVEMFHVVKPKAVANILRMTGKSETARAFLATATTWMDEVKKELER